MMAYEEIRLVKPSLGLKDKALEYRQEHFDFGDMEMEDAAGEVLGDSGAESGGDFDFLD